MTREEEHCLKQIHDETVTLKAKELAIKRLGEILEETFILDLLPSKALMRALEDIAVSKTVASKLKQKAKTLLKKYRI